MSRTKLADKKDMREELLKQAMDMIQVRGYNAFNYQDLAEKLKIRKASIHYHFNTKEEMAEALIVNSIAGFKTWTATMTKQKLTPLQKLEAYLEFYIEFSTHGERICPMGSLASDWETLPKRVRSLVPEIIRAHVEFLKGLLVEGRKAGLFSKKLTVEEQAQFLVALIQGSLQILRVQKERERFPKMIAIAKEMLLVSHKVGSK